VNVSLVLNHRCNLRCRYCYMGRKFNRAMPMAVVRKAVDLAFERSRQGYVVVSLFGGEPLLELDLAEQAVAYSRAQAARRGARVHFTISTNGTLLDERRLRLLVDHEFQVQVSLDGGAPAQDASRRFRNGRSSYAVVSQNLRKLMATRLRVNVVSVVDPANAHLLSDSLDALAGLGVTEVHFSPNLLGAWDRQACERFEAGLRELGDNLLARFRGGRDLRVDPLSGKIVTRLIHGVRPSVRCGFGSEEWAVAPSGRIYPCDRVVGQDDSPELSIGEVRTGFDEPRRDALLASKAEVDPECAACEHSARCSHWCGCHQLETSGRLGRVSPTFCWMERRFIAEADRLASTLFAESNPAFLRRYYLAEIESE